jgi:GTP-binding protein
VSRQDPDTGEAERLFAAPCHFFASAETVDALPAPGLPEVAFAGRSNVGKSSLVNALVRRRGLARVSRTPGRTQSLLFFELGGRLVLVDFPGYGYAQVGRARARAWGELIVAYLAERPTLRRVCLLVDAVVGLGPLDRDAMAILKDSAVPYQAVLTKSDKLAPDDLARVLAGVTAELSRHPAAHPEVLAVSAQTGAGMPGLRQSLVELAAPARLR